MNGTRALVESCIGKNIVDVLVDAQEHRPVLLLALGLENGTAGSLVQKRLQQQSNATLMAIYYCFQCLDLPQKQVVESSPSQVDIEELASLRAECLRHVEFTTSREQWMLIEVIEPASNHDNIFKMIGRLDVVQLRTLLAHCKALTKIKANK